MCLGTLRPIDFFPQSRPIRSNRGVERVNEEQAEPGQTQRGFQTKTQGPSGTPVRGPKRGSYYDVDGRYILSKDRDGIVSNI